MVLNWLRRHKKTTAVLLLLTLVLGPYLYSRIASQFRQVRTIIDDNAIEYLQGNEIRIAVMNIAHGRGQADSNWADGGAAKKERIEKIADLLIELDADVVVLNEVDFSSTWSGHQNQAEVIATQAGYPHRVEQRNFDFRFIYGSWKFGNAVLCRLPIVLGRPSDYPGRNDWEQYLFGKKQGAKVVIEYDEYRLLELSPIHLEHRDEGTRVRSVRKLLSAVTAMPTILAGDFNSTPNGFPGSEKSAEGENAIDVIRASGNFQSRPEKRAGEEDYTFSSTQPEKVIDWIFVSAECEIVNYRIIHSDLSDHFAVLATVRIK